MLETISRHWWILLSRGILAVLLGALALAVPGLTALALALLFGAYALIDGVFAIVASIRMSHAGTKWEWLLAEGILGVLFGIAAMTFPEITLLLLVYIVAAWAIVMGITAISTAMRVRQSIAGEWLWIGLGIISVLFGLLVAFEPVYGVFVVVYTFAFYAILTGVTFVALSLRLRSASSPAPSV